VLLVPRILGPEIDLARFAVSDAGAAHYTCANGEKRFTRNSFRCSV